MNYQPSYTLQPSPDAITRSTPSPPPSDTVAYNSYLPPISSFNNPSPNNNNHYQRQLYPTSSPYQPHPYPQQQSLQHTSPDPTPPLSKLRLPPPTPTSYFPNGYASPATSSYSSSEPGSRDEIDLMEPGSLGGSHFHTGGHAIHSSSGVDGMIFRGDGTHLDKHTSRNDSREREHHQRKRWNMRDFTLVQTVGMYRP